MQSERLQNVVAFVYIFCWRDLESWFANRHVIHRTRFGGGARDHQMSDWSW